MNVYDFDKTIYDGDSSIDFFFFSLKRNPLLIRYIPKQLFGSILYSVKVIDKTRFKEYFFSFLKGIDVEEFVRLFWEEYGDKVQDWYLSQKKGSDIIISASPEFLLKPICEKLEIKKLIASRVDCKSGKFNGPNCKGIEKAKRLFAECSVKHIDNFYSDSLSDQPLADIANNAFLISKGEIKKWYKR